MNLNKSNFSLHKILNKISTSISLKIWGLRLPLSYVFFNKMYKFFIMNKKIENKTIQNFHNIGFTKLDLNISEELSKIKLDFKPLKDNEKKQIIFTDSDNQKNLKEIISTNLRDTINDLKKYYNSNIVVGNVHMFRNHYTDKSVEGKKEDQVYANFYHNDGYLITYIKIFINLMDVNEEDGPLNIISKQKTKAFIKKTKYKDRYNYIPLEKDDADLVYKNIGKFGDCFLFSTPECMHKASIPKKHRDMMQIILVATPNEKLKLSNINPFEDNKDIIFSSKPYGIVKVIHLLLKHIFFKWNFKTKDSTI